MEKQDWKDWECKKIIRFAVSFRHFTCPLTIVSIPFKLDQNNTWVLFWSSSQVLSVIWEWQKSPHIREMRLETSNTFIAVSHPNRQIWRALMQGCPHLGNRKAQKLDSSHLSLDGSWIDKDHIGVKKTEVIWAWKGGREAGLTWLPSPPPQVDSEESFLPSSRQWKINSKTGSNPAIKTTVH